MTDRQELRDILRPVGEAILPSREQRKLAAVSSAFADDGLIRPDALARALPAYVLRWYLSGTASTGTNVAEEYDLPSQVRLTGIRIRVKTAPTTNEYTVRLTANGAEVEIASVEIGQTSGRSLLNYIADPGTVLRLDVVSGGAAANATILVAYAPASA